MEKSREFQLIVCAASQLGIFRRQTWLMRSLNFKIAAGECWLLTGQNGSGKTTLLRTLAGLCIPDEGEVSYLNTDNADHDFHPLYLASPPAKIPELTVAENCQYQAILRWGKRPDPATLNRALAYWSIADLAEQPMDQLSQGQQQRAALSILLLGPAVLWLLDEPTTALDAKGTQALFTLCAQHQEQGGSIVMATHSLTTAF